MTHCLLPEVMGAGHLFHFEDERTGATTVEVVPGRREATEALLIARQRAERTFIDTNRLRSELNRYGRKTGQPIVK